MVAIEPRSGRVRVMASNPPFDPNRIPYDLEQLNQNEAETPLFDRATQGQYPPGSTFKVVTAAAGLDTGAITPESAFAAPSPLDVQGLPLQNDFNQSFGPIGLDTALTLSVNTWFAQLGEKLGAETMFEYMDRFGFNAPPPIDLPEGEVYKSGIYDYEAEKLLGPGDPVDIARVAIGQERLTVTPLQMAEVAATVANGGRLMKPQLWSRVVDSDGRVTKSLDPSEYSRPISAQTAEELATAMEGVVSQGTGTNAAIEGVDVAGKTGTAETPSENCGGASEANQAWFIGFAPAEDPKIAIAATVECTPQFGNDVAGADLPRRRGNDLRRRMRAAAPCLRSAKAARRRPLPAPAPDRHRRHGRRLARRGRRTCSARWRSRSCTRASPRTASSSSASAARPRPRPASSTPTSSPSTTAARSRAPTTSRCSTCEGSRSSS